MTEAPSRGVGLSMATFNVQHGRPAGRGRGVDLGGLDAACASLDVDILGLQEVEVCSPRSHFANEPRRVATAIGEARHAFAAARRPFVIGAEGNALVSRGPAPIEDVDVVRLPLLGRHERRAALVARAHGLTVAVTHLSKHHDEARAQLEAVLAVLADRPGPRLLLADANLEWEVVAALCVPRGYVVADGPPTFPAERPRRRIDHMAVDGGWSFDALQAERCSVSDHRPLRGMSRPSTIEPTA